MDRWENQIDSAKTPRAWVVGRNGLLGKSLEFRLAKSTKIWIPDAKANWADQQAAENWVEQNCAAFFREVGDNDWVIAWCAGRSVVGSTRDQINNETSLLEVFFKQVQRSAPKKPRGKVFFASSAGGIYAGSTDSLITESSAPKPISDYGRGKINHESIFRAHSQKLGIDCYIGRIANLYGPGQDISKPQGLISQLCRSTILKRPLNIYVPLQTSRNYIFVDDAAGIIADLIQGGESYVEKIIAAPQNATISTLIRTHFEVFKKKPLISLGVSSLTNKQPQRLNFKSQIMTELDDRQFRSLASGFKATMKMGLKT